MSMPTRMYTDDGRLILFHGAWFVQRVAYDDDGDAVARALYDYAATIDDEFDFRGGDVIAVTDTPDDGWWSGELEDETRRQAGRHVFPRNFVEMLRGPSPPTRGEMGMGRSAVPVAMMPTPPMQPPVWPAVAYSDSGRPVLFYVKALYDYAATIDKEFDFQTGDVIAVTDTPDDGWWSGELLDVTRRQAGRHVFPSNFVSLF